MLSDEEEKALKVVNKRTERLMEELKIEEEDLIDEPKIAYLITQIEANKTLVNLIEKQSKEIEELKTKNKILEAISLSFNEIQDRDKHWKDKIKARIEEEKECGSVDGTNEMIIEVLQSLLEKE